MITASRYHDFSYGHRVVGHEGKCRHLHGHNGRIHFNCVADQNRLDSVGRVIDFCEIKTKLCMWVEDNWDHKFLAWNEDEVIENIFGNPLSDGIDMLNVELWESMVFIPFNPTAENIAKYLVEVIGPQQLKGTGITLVSVTVEETRKCSASYSKD